MEFCYRGTQRVAVFGVSYLKHRDKASQIHTRTKFKVKEKRRGPPVTWVHYLCEYSTWIDLVVERADTCIYEALSRQENIIEGTSLARRLRRRPLA